MFSNDRVKTVYKVKTKMKCTSIYIKYTFKKCRLLFTNNDVNIAIPV